MRGAVNVVAVPANKSCVKVNVTFCLVHGKEKMFVLLSMVCECSHLDFALVADRLLGVANVCLRLLVQLVLLFLFLHFYTNLPATTQCTPHLLEGAS